MGELAGGGFVALTVNASDKWHGTCNMWHMTQEKDTWQMTQDTWHITGDMCHVTHNLFISVFVV